MLTGDNAATAQAVAQPWASRVSRGRAARGKADAVRALQGATARSPAWSATASTTRPRSPPPT